MKQVPARSHEYELHDECVQVLAQFFEDFLNYTQLSEQLIQLNPFRHVDQSYLAEHYTTYFVTCRILHEEKAIVQMFRAPQSKLRSTVYQTIYLQAFCVWYATEACYLDAGICSATYFKTRRLPLKLSCAPTALAKLKQQVASGDSRHERHNVRCEMLWADDGVFS